MSEYDDYSGQHHMHHLIPGHEAAHHTSEHLQDFGPGISNTHSPQIIFDSPDPLKMAHQYEFEPFHINPGQHFVQPHQVSGYVRHDGTPVEGYYRDGDGDTSVDRPLEAGGGYTAGNPDGNPFNNKNLFDF